MTRIIIALRTTFHRSDMVIRRKAQKRQGRVDMAGERTIAKCVLEDAKAENGAGGGSGARRSEVCQITEVRNINDS